MKPNNDKEEIERWCSYKVNVVSKGMVSRFDGERDVEKFECVISFSDTDQHQETIKNYLNWYLGFNTDTDDVHLHSLLHDSWVCAKALAVFYFRGINKLYLKAECGPGSYVHELPAKAPDTRTENMVIWVNNVDRSTEETEYTVAVALVKAIRESGKISVDDAREYVRSEFGEHQRLDSDVMFAFSKLGGKSTKKYLRL